MMRKTTHFVITPIKLGVAVLLIGSLLWVLNQSLPESTPGRDEAAPMVSASIPITKTPELTASRATPVLEITPVQEICDCEPRTEVITYTVQKGDTIFYIADAFGLKPETILLSNYNKLFDNPMTLAVGMELNILPVDGAYYEWQEGDDLNEVASRFGVQPEDILDWPGNHLDRDTIGDFTQPNIQPGTMLVIPGGQRAFQLWSTPPPTPIE
jgi:LysM repeat protein